MTLPRWTLLSAAMCLALPAAKLEAVVPPDSPLAGKSFRDERLSIPTQYLAREQAPANAVARIDREMASLGVGADSAFYDARAGRLSSLILSVPLVPGEGVGNTLEWEAGTPANDAALKEAVWTAVLEYLRRHEDVLRVDRNELSAPRIGVFEHGRLIQVYSPRVISGIAVRDSGVTAIVNHGNLVLLGLQNWGDAGAMAASPRVTADEARLVVSQHVQPFFVDGWTKETHLAYVPMVEGDGYNFRLAWVVGASVPGDLGTWEGLVDAVSGALIAFEDKSQYVARRAVGGVYPVSNDQRPPDGFEQIGWPMPYLSVATPAGPMAVTFGLTLYGV